jgi:hypothetical protein
MDGVSCGTQFCALQPARHIHVRHLNHLRPYALTGDLALARSLARRAGVCGQPRNGGVRRAPGSDHGRRAGDAVGHAGRRRGAGERRYGRDHTAARRVRRGGAAGLGGGEFWTGHVRAGDSVCQLPANHGSAAHCLRPPVFSPWFCMLAELRRGDVRGGGWADAMHGLRRVCQRALREWGQLLGHRACASAVPRQPNLPLRVRAERLHGGAVRVPGRVLAGPLLPELHHPAGRAGRMALCLAHTLGDAALPLPDQAAVHRP